MEYEIAPILTEWQGHISYSLYSIYAVNPEAFVNIVGSDPGPFLFSNMLYGQGVYIYTRPAMRSLKTGFRILYSIYGTYIFNFSSLIIFYYVGERCKDSPFLASVVSFLAGKCMCTLFYSYLYFVDKCADAETRTDSIFDFILYD